jgi:ABC-type branched-subunit amino acid transport system substrate-binding protein
MTSLNRALRRPLLTTLAVSMTIALAACGGGGDGEKAATQGVTQDPNVKFTGDPVKVMTFAPIDTEVLNTPSILEIAKGAVININNGGGVNGHEVQLITCNEGFDANIAADCARDAVKQNVAAVIGGFSIMAPSIMPILEKAGIPWVGPPLVSDLELTDPTVYPVNSGVMSMAALGRRAVEDGCKSVFSVASQTGNEASDKLALLVDDGMASAGGPKPTLIRVPAIVSDYSGTAQQLDGADCIVISAPPAIVTGIVAANASLGADVKYYIFGGALTSEVIKPLGTALEGAITTSNYPIATDKAWDEAKSVVGDLADDDNGGWSSVFAQNTWVAYQAFANAAASFTGPDLSAALDKATEVDTAGLTPPISFAKENDAQGLNRVFNTQVRYLTVKNSQLAYESKDYFDLSPALSTVN